VKIALKDDYRWKQFAAACKEDFGRCVFQAELIAQGRGDAVRNCLWRTP